MMRGLHARLCHTFLVIISRVALYQASVSGLCDGPSGNLSVRLSVGRSVCVCKVYCGIWLSVSGCRWWWWVGSVGVLDGGGDRRREGAVLGVNLGRPIVTNEDFATRLFPNHFQQDLFLLKLIIHYVVHAARQQQQPRCRDVVHHSGSKTRRVPRARAASQEQSVCDASLPCL